MALPEGTKLRKGDVVALHGAVRYDRNDDGYFFLDIPGASTCMVKLDQIAGVIRRRFERGEQVKHRIPSPYAGDRLVVEAISEDGKSLWLRRNDDGFVTLGSDEVQLVEPPAAPEDDPDFSEIEVANDEDGEAAQ